MNRKENDLIFEAYQSSKVAVFRHNLQKLMGDASAAVDHYLEGGADEDAAVDLAYQDLIKQLEHMRGTYEIQG